MDGWMDSLTVGYLLGTYSVKKSSQESVNTQQTPVFFYGIYLISEILSTQQGSIREYGLTDGRRRKQYPLHFLKKTTTKQQQIHSL